MAAVTIISTRGMAAMKASPVTIDRASSRRTAGIQKAVRTTAVPIRTQPVRDWASTTAATRTAGAR